MTLLFSGATALWLFQAWTVRADDPRRLLTGWRANFQADPKLGNSQQNLLVLAEMLVCENEEAETTGSETQRQGREL